MAFASTARPHSAQRGPTFETGYCRFRFFSAFFRRSCHLLIFTLQPQNLRRRSGNRQCKIADTAKQIEHAVLSGHLEQLNCSLHH